MRYERHFELDVQQFFVIEGSCRSRLALELDGQQFFAVEGSCRSRPAHEELDGQQFFAIEGSCRRKISKWKSRAQVVRELPQVPQGTTASTTPPFVRAGYDCRNNTTVLRRPEAAGWAPLVCAGPLTTSLRGLWVSGLLPRGNGGTNEGAATQKPTERHKGAATQKPTSERRNSRSNLGARGGDPRTLASWRHLFSASCRGNCLRYCDKFQADTLRDGMSLVGFRNWTIGPYIPVRVTYAVLRSRRAPRGPRQLYAVSLLYANAPGLFGGRGEMAMAVPCCPLRSTAACGSESRLIGSLCSVSVVISNGLQPSLEGHRPQRACRRSGANLDTTRQCQRAQARRPQKRLRRSVTFNPQGWETIFGRYPREVSRSTAVDAGDTYWAYASTQWY